MTNRIQLRRGTAAQWTAANPVLTAGEIGFETDTGKHKIGDGTAHWATLPYFLDVTHLDNAYAPASGSSEYVSETDVQPRQTGIMIKRYHLATQSVGTSGYGNVNGAAYCLMDAVNDNEWVTSFKVPDWVTTIYVDMLWIALTASGTGVPRLRAAVGDYRTDGGGVITAPTLPASGDIKPALPATANSVQRTVFGPFTVDPTHDQTLTLGRIGNSSQDTADSTQLGLIGAEIRFA